MALLGYPDPEEFPDETRAAYQRFVEHYNRTPLALLMLGHFPAALRTFSEFDNSALSEGQLDRRTKELIFVTSSTARDCYYCAGGHSRALVEHFGMSQEAVERIRANPSHAQLDEPLQSILLFTRKVSLDAASIDEDDIARLHRAGLDNAAILEVICVCMVAAGSNLMAKALHLRDDLENYNLTGYF